MTKDILSTALEAYTSKNWVIWYDWSVFCGTIKFEDFENS